METCGAEDLPCVPFAQMPPSDDRSFVAAGVPTISVAMLPGVDAHQLWLMMNGGKNSGLGEGNSPLFSRLSTRRRICRSGDDHAIQRMLRFALTLVRSIANRLAVSR